MGTDTGCDRVARSGSAGLEGSERTDTAAAREGGVVQTLWNAVAGRTNEGAAGGFISAGKSFPAHRRAHESSGYAGQTGGRRISAEEKRIYSRFP